MARYRRKRISLYEAMTQSRRKSSAVKRPPQEVHRTADYGRTLEKLHSEKTDEDKAAEEKLDVQVPVPGITAKWWRKPRVMQFNAGRIDFSISYPVAIAIVLGIILLTLLAFRAGQYFSSLSRQPSGHGVHAEPGEAASLVNPPSSVVGRETRDEIRGTSGTQEETTGAPVTAEPRLAKPTGNNVIVLVEYSRRADLVPVQKHFGHFGIDTEIASWAGKYFLITKNKFESFGIGSDGYKAKQRIVEVGALYKDRAPEGYETFAPRFFRDAYGKKVE